MEWKISTYNMVSPGSLFGTPTGIRMSPGKARVLFRVPPSLTSVHSALTRVSAALAESENLHTRMMVAGVQKRAAHQRHQTLRTKLHNLQYRMRWRPLESYQRQINKAQKNVNANLPNVINKERTSERLIRQWENSMKRYHQLARRVVYLNGTRNLNNRPLTHAEKETIRITSQIIRDMVSARRTVRHLPLNKNTGSMITRSAARR